MNPPERFAVSTAGMAQLHAGRPIWQLLKELIANAWDEGASCTVAVSGDWRPFAGGPPRPPTPSSADSRPGRWQYTVIAKRQPGTMLPGQPRAVPLPCSPEGPFATVHEALLAIGVPQAEIDAHKYWHRHDRLPQWLADAIEKKAVDAAERERATRPWDVKRGLAVWTVEDNGPGFSDIADAWTIWGWTPKRGQPDVRGRFNLGEKEIISIAKWAKVDTVGTRVDFPEDGGRVIQHGNGRKRGTVITVALEMTEDEVAETLEVLRRFLTPKGLTYTVDGEDVPYREPAHELRRRLPTVIQDSPEEPVRNTSRVADVRVIEPRRTALSYLYEMGIPVQPIDCTHDVDVGQKIPLPPNRDTVRDTYLQDIYSAVLTVTGAELSDDLASEVWVQAAVEDPDTPDEVVKDVMEKKLGPKAVLWSSDLMANERAETAGYGVVRAQSLSPVERERYAGVGLQRASVAFGVDVEEKAVDPDERMENVGLYAHWLAAHLLHVQLRVSFYRSETHVQAEYADGLLRFNVARIADDWWDGPPAERHTELILHEIAHHGEKEHAHRGGYVHNLAKLAAKATHLAKERGEWWGQTLVRISTEACPQCGRSRGDFHRDEECLE